MKTSIVLLLMITYLTAVPYAAAKSSDVLHYCQVYSSAFGYAAAERDRGESPKSVFKDISADPTLKPKTIRAIISSVYNDKAYAKAGGEKLINKMFKTCMSQHK